MIELREEYPFIEYGGRPKPNLIKHWAEDENGVKYYVLQKETGYKYSEVVDVYPCRYTYEVTDEMVEEEDGNE